MSAIQAPTPIAVSPRPLNARLWQLVRKETAHTINAAERVELDRLCETLEREAA